MDLILNIFSASWELLLESSVYILFGIIVGGILKIFLSTEYVVKHLGTGRFMPVLKASFFGIPIPLCSCGVLPAAASLKKQGASNGATISFLVSTPESGVDSISITYALLDPIMTIARPVSAFISAFAAGITESFVSPPNGETPSGLGACLVDNCCSGEDCTPDEHARHHNLTERVSAGLKYAFGELWGDLAIWFTVGLILSGIITVLVPDNLITSYLGGGFGAMLIMLAAGVPIYICATASTPIAAALILKGVSPGVALVFLLVGPATNMASLSVLTGILGRTATIRYLAILSISAVLCGLGLDLIYQLSDISAQAVIGEAGELVPYPIQFAGALVLIMLSLKPFYFAFKDLARKFTGHRPDDDSCGCHSDSCSSD